ncbi:Zinc finger transcription factor ace1 [Cytospora mali]|uniref:Zinc finger transcription factor ace1 n=1 Tax=Cytospora mali TaxID=578113 RepID=A0A194VAZ0_CYTMA|nr:Zinc finger transcription factor ace1 [Valsa mali var. pyri (nom. inval.)]
MDITSHGSGLNPNSWQYLDSGISLQAIQEKITRDAGTTNYIGHHMDFQQNAVIAQQQLHALSPNGDTEQMQGTAMQMSPVGLATGNELAHLEESHEQPQDHQAPTETTDTNSDDGFNDADFLNDDSISDQDAAEDEGRDEIQNAQVDLSRVEKPRQDVDRAVQPIQDGNESTSSEPEDIESPDHATAPEYYPLPHPISSSSTTSTKAGTQSISNDAVIIAQPDYAAVEESSVHGLDIVNDKSKASDLIKALEDKGTLAELLEQLGYQKSRATNATTRATPLVRSLASDSGQVTCNEPSCGKTFPRPCELKKHQKRHEKPYGCTFPKCFKRFGSKNDWKRHENSQHHQLELWKCDEPSKTDPKDVCGRACHRREQFKIHLSRDHEICDQGTIDSKLDRCRVGRNCETRFWCGFCKVVVEIQDGGRNAWTERFNHIDDHFSGRNYVKMDISEWKSMDPDTNDIDLNLPGPNDQSYSSPPGPSSGPSLGVDNGLKRSADAEAQQPRSRNKRPRAIETLWFCCHCGGQSLTSTSMNCCMDDCNGHIKCNACRVERVPREPQVVLQELQE